MICATHVYVYNTEPNMNYYLEHFSSSQSYVNDDEEEFI